ncbi:angiopoietin-related protein 3 isoform X2 [Dasypus novemcinctus]|uniref:angiopoietin-related protein 3 isoform X2 n=1 Tax=Dasypus novemcinctus TaxID=9361 RepID=UPI00266019DB|nr:angiopoietin-related protein 3 isoform X2 [Dasypus novemcinctus]
MYMIQLFLFIAPLVLSSRIGQDYSSFDSVSPEPKSRFAMLDDVKILANGLLQLGHGLKDFVHKTKGQINDIFQKLNIFDKSFYALSLQTNEIKEEEKELRRTTSKLQVKNEEVKNMSLRLNSKLESLMEEKVLLQQKVRYLEEQLTNLIQNQPEIQEYPEVTSLKTFIEQQNNNIKDLLQTMEEQYRQLNQQHNQIKEIENQLKRTGIQEPIENSSFYSKPRAPRTTPSLRLNETKKVERDGIPADCTNINNRGEHTSGIYAIRPRDSQVFNVYCDVISGSSWTLIQHRMDGSQNFNESWENYKYGFGRLDGGWWWHEVCEENHLNGKYNKPRTKSKPERRKGICWKSKTGKLYSIKSTKMLIHPTDLENFK